LKLFPNALLLLRLSCLLFRPVVKAGDTSLDFFEQPVLCSNFTIDGVSLGEVFQLCGCDAHVNGRNLLYALSDVAAVVDSLRLANLFQRTVTGIGPALRPSEISTSPIMAAMLCATEGFH
jgi:hypothetical protein